MSTPWVHDRPSRRAESAEAVLDAAQQVLADIDPDQQMTLVRGYGLLALLDDVCEQAAGLLPDDLLARTEETAALLGAALDDAAQELDADGDGHEHAG